MDLEVDVNGQETFFVSMKILASFSGKLRKMFGNNSAEKKKKKRQRFKLIFHDFPNGAEGFELVVRFCYTGGRIDISPSNVVHLCSAFEYLEIEEDQTSEFFESVHSWTWLELLACLKQCQEVFPSMSSLSIVQEILNAIVERISMLNSSSTFDFSCSDFSGTRFSSEISTVCSSSSSSPTVNWLQDLEFLNTRFFEKAANAMVSCKLDHGMVCSFLLHYQRVKYVCLLPLEKKCRIIETLITSLSSLNEGLMFFPFRKLFNILQACHTLKMAKPQVKKVESMIGSRLDEATLDDLMVPSHGRRTCAYDVNLVLRLLKAFLGERRKKSFVPRLKRAGALIDSYLGEVAPDPHLRPSKFLALALALPDSSRESHDTLCQAVLMYFKVHVLMREEEKMGICSVLNFDKLSTESLVEVVKSKKFKKMGNGVDQNLEFRLDSSSLYEDEDENEEIVVKFSKGKGCRNLQKIYSNVDVTCPKSSKSLPRLCS